MIFFFRQEIFVAYIGPTYPHSTSDQGGTPYNRRWGVLLHAREGPSGKKKEVKIGETYPVKHDGKFDGQKGEMYP